MTLETSAKTRIYGLDLLRGLVMVIMALDHTRDYFHFDAYLHDPLDVTTTSVPLFFTRWITHFCAPVFVLLAGTSIYLQGLRKPRPQLSTFLIKRGLWLVLVEIFVVTLAITFDLSYRSFILQVIWAIGISMVLMGFIIRLPYLWILALGAILVAGHNVFDFFESTRQGFLWDLVRNGSFAMYDLGSGHQLVIVYPFLPWLGLMMLGYCLGKLYAPDFNPYHRRSLLMQWGVGALVLFLLLRLTNVYGDPFPWSVQDHPTFTILSFLNVHKYPPSLLYVCITIGPALVFLSLFEKSDGKISRVLSVYGRVPFFYYVLHFYMLHLLCMILFVSRGYAITEQTPDIFGMAFRYVIVGEGYPLTVVYFIWIMVVASLYPLCKWFSEYKRKSHSAWLSYV